MCDKPMGGINHIGCLPFIRPDGFKHRIDQRDLLFFESAGIKVTQMVKLKNCKRFTAD